MRQYTFFIIIQFCTRCVSHDFKKHLGLLRKRVSKITEQKENLFVIKNLPRSKYKCWLLQSNFEFFLLVSFYVLHHRHIDILQTTSNMNFLHPQIRSVINQQSMSIPLLYKIQKSIFLFSDEVDVTLKHIHLKHFHNIQQTQNKVNKGTIEGMLMLKSQPFIHSRQEKFNKL